MTQIDPPNQLSDHSKQYRTLRQDLILLFLMLALVPLAIVSAIGYQQARASLIKAASNELLESSILSSRYVLDWFDYRLRDIKHQSESNSNTQLLQTLHEGLINSNLPLHEFVGSETWRTVLKEKQSELENLKNRYDYIYDLFLIDTDGNILYTVAEESDLGTNILKGPYRFTVFSDSVQKTIQDRETYFSEVGNYQPSNNILAQFITSPLINEQGKIVGVFALQIYLDRVFNLLQVDHEKISLTHYLVSEDGFLRSPLGRDDLQLSQRIDTEQYKLWRAEYIDEKYNDEMHEEHADDEEAFEYIGPKGEVVFGLHQLIKIPGLNWALISEIDKEEAIAPIIWLSKITITLVLITMFVVIILAVLFARRITNPIVELANASMLAAEGVSDAQVSINQRNEIGLLAKSFNHMLNMRNQQDLKMREANARIQQALDDLEEQQFALDQHSIVSITDEQGSITFVNDKQCQVSGFSRADMIGKNHRITSSGFHDKDFYDDLYKTIKRGNVWQGELCNRSKGGKLYWLDTTIIPFKGRKDKSESFIAISTDITKRKKVEQDLIKAKEAAEDAAKAKSEFLASMSHEIRTPMNGVLGMLSLLKNTKLNNDQQHKLSLAESSAKALLALINDILDFSKVEAGKLELEELDFDLRWMLGEFSEAMALLAQQKGLELILDVTKIEITSVRGDPDRLRQVFTNLVGNAIKFTEHGEIVIRVSAEDTGSGRIRLCGSVSDTGIGIPDDKLPKLFESFSQVDASTTRKYGGTGLGLAICKRICELMGGTIRVESDYEKGSNFKFEVYVAQSERAESVKPPFDISGNQYLVVDDNETNSKVLKSQLEHWGAKVDLADNAQLAMSRIEDVTKSQTSVYDLIFLDLYMSDTTGIELAKKIRQLKYGDDLKLVLMTPIGHTGDSKKFIEQGVDGYFPKPATTVDLYKALSLTQLGQSQVGDSVEVQNRLADDRGKNQSITYVLLVEDNLINQRVALGLLSDLEIDAEVANNGAEALAFLQRDNSKYDLIFMDCQMPVMDGYEATERIRNGEAGDKIKSIPIIALTANAMKGDRDRCFQAGMDDYLSKPIDPDRLADKLEHWSLDKATKPAINKIMKNVEKASETESESVAKPVWNKPAAIKRMGGKEERLIPLINLFLTDMPARVDQMKLALSEQNWEEVTEVAHTIKGVAANLGGELLQHYAGEMEQMGREQDESTLQVSLPVLEEAWRLLTSEFESYLNGGSGESTSV